MIAYSMHFIVIINIVKIEFCALLDTWKVNKLIYNSRCDFSGNIFRKTKLFMLTSWSFWLWTWQNGLTSSITSLGDATLMAIPMSASLSRTSWKSKLRLDLALDRARPYSVHKHASDGSQVQLQSLQHNSSRHSPLRDTWCQTSPSCPALCPSARNCRCPWFLRSEPVDPLAVGEEKTSKQLWRQPKRKVIFITC